MSALTGGKWLLHADESNLKADGAEDEIYLDA